MKNRHLFLLNFLVACFLVLFFLANLPFPTSRAIAPKSQPGAAAPTARPPSHLAFLTYSQPMSNAPDSAYYPALVSTFVYPLTANGLETSQPLTLFSQPDDMACETDQAMASPNSQYLLLQYNCHTDLFARLLQANISNPHPTVFPRGYVLDWSPDGGWFLFRNTDDNLIYLIEAATLYRMVLTLPSSTYNASFMPDGQHITYATSQGIGLGSELGTLNLADGRLTIHQQYPRHIVAFPRWSPDGKRLAYILLADNNIPYTVGELWLADDQRQPLTLLAQADAGHGYPPVWHPDGQSITYIHRENPADRYADQLPYALHSNLYQVDVTTQTITPLTDFNQTLVYDPAWSADGSQLAFTAGDAVWLLTPGSTPVQVSPSGIARHPMWLTRNQN